MTTRDHFSSALAFFAVALLYGALSWLSLRFFSINGLVGILWPASGLGLAALLLGGRRYAGAIWLGASLPDMLTGTPWLAAVGSGAGVTLAPLFGHWLLTRPPRFDLTLSTMGDYSRLVVQAAFLASGISALVGTGSLALFNALAPGDWPQNLLHWWMGGALGVMLITPLVLLWRHRPDPVPEPRLWPEVAVMLPLALVTGQIIFLDWFDDSLGLLINQGYWMFLFVTWAAIRLGKHGVVLMLCLISVQVLVGLHSGRGWFAQDIPDQLQPINSGFYLMTLSLVGMSLAIYFTARKQAEATLRIAATVFQCQEGMIVTDADRRILRTNHSFSRIMGYSNEEVIGQLPAFMRSDRHPDSFYENTWLVAREQGLWSGEIWHRRKSGEVFPQWTTCSSVKDSRGTIVNYVITHTDITYQKRQESEHRAAEAAHRDALIREVHHRIKNNLQGITGMLRQYSLEHPELSEPINQAISQVRSVAVIHGLQGRTSLQTVRLCELTSAIAADIAVLWLVPIRVDIPQDWCPGILAETEAVPVALVLNELIINAVKHGGKAHQHIEISLRKGHRPDCIQVRIRNAGHWPARASQPDVHRNGLQLVNALLPSTGAHLRTAQQAGMVEVVLELESPVITLETEEIA